MTSNVSSQEEEGNAKEKQQHRFEPNQGYREIVNLLVGIVRKICHSRQNNRWAKMREMMENP